MKKIIIAACLLTLSCVAASAQPQLEISLSLRIAPVSETYVEGEAIPIRLTFRNVSKKQITFTLAENDKDPPGFIWARIWDMNGKLLTQNDTLKDGWWTSWVLSSSTYQEKKSDRISLLRDEKYTRTVDLRGLLAGCDGLRSGLKAGTYRVQLALDPSVSNEAEITIKPKSQ